MIVYFILRLLLTALLLYGYKNHGFNDVAKHDFSIPRKK